jgi:hypothetical protein
LSQFLQVGSLQGPVASPAKPEALTPCEIDPSNTRTLEVEAGKNASYLAHRDSQGIHLKDRFLKRRPLAALEELGYKLALAIPVDLQAFDLARARQEIV